jgi:hypothetical protein
MSSPSNAKHGESLAGWIGRLLSALESAGNRYGGLEGCAPEEADRMAQDLGLTRGELIRLAAMGPDAADEIYRRLDVLDVDAEELQRREPTLMRELARTCSFCASKARCSTDLNSCPYASDWTGYCPNAPLLQALQQGATTRK